MQQAEISRALTAKPVADLLNKIEPPARIMLHCVPTRVVRVIATDDSFKTFRVEQLVITGNDRASPKGNWTTLSTHGSPVTGESYPIACKSAIEAQDHLRRKLQAQKDKRRIIRI